DPFTDTPPQRGEWLYRVKAVTCFGESSYSAPLAVDTRQREAPTALTAVSAASPAYRPTLRVLLSWTPPQATAAPGGCGAVEAYQVWRKQGSGASQQVATVNGATPYFTDFNVAEGATYTYEVRAVDCAGTGAAATTTVSTTLPATPTVTVQPRGPATAPTVTVSWSGAANGCGWLEHARVERRTLGSTDWSDAGTLGGPLPRAMPPTAPVPALAGELEDGGVQAGLQYEYRVTVTNCVGSRQSAIVVADLRLPGAPRNLAAHAAGLPAYPGPGLEAHVSWTAPAVTGCAPIVYDVLRQGPDDAAPVLVAAGIAATSHREPLPDEATHTFTVLARNCIGDGGQATDDAETSVPEAVTNLAATTTLTTATLTWTAPTAGGCGWIEGYVVERLHLASGTTTTATVPSTTGWPRGGSASSPGAVATTYTDSAVTDGHAYRYTVTPVGCPGAGDPASRTVTVGPNDAPVWQGFAAVTTSEDEPYTFGKGYSVSDSDAEAGDLLDLRVHLEPATAGTLALPEHAPAPTAGSPASGDFTLRVDAAGVTAALDGLTFTPAADACGASPPLALLRLRADDLGQSGFGGPQVGEHVTQLQVTCVNDPPSFTLQEAASLQEDAGTVSLPAFATAVRGGPAGTGAASDQGDETAQRVRFTLTHDGDLFLVAPSLAPEAFASSPGTSALSLTLRPNACGASTVTVVLEDDSGAKSPASTAILTVGCAPDAPRHTVGGAPVTAASAILVQGTEAFPLEGVDAVAVHDDDDGTPLQSSLRVTVSVPNDPQSGMPAATLAAQPAGAATVSGSGTTELVLEGSAADIRASLASLAVTPGSCKSTTLTLSSHDGTSTTTDVVPLQVSCGGPAVSLQLPASVREGDSVELVATLSHPAEGLLVVPLQAGAGSEAGLADIRLLRGPEETLELRFEDGAVQATLQLHARSDGVDEPDETLLLAAQRGHGYRLTDASTAAIRIEDADVPTFHSAAVASPATREGDTFLFRLVRDMPERAMLVTLALAGGPAAAGADDVELNEWTVQFEAGQAEASVAVRTVLDGVDEPDETLTLTVLAVAGEVAAGAAASHVVLDVDDPALSIHPLGDAGEGGTLRFAIVRTNADLPLDVHLLWGGEAAAADFLGARPTVVTVPQNVAWHVLEVEVRDDTVAEGHEEVTLTLLPGTGYTVFEPAQATARILDDDLPQVAVAATRPSITEGQPALPTLRVSRPAEDASGVLQVQLRLADSSAAGASDLDGPLPTVTLAAGQQEALVALAAVLDLRDEPTEALRVEVAPADGYTAAAGFAEVLVLDADDPQVHFLVEDGTLGEDGPDHGRVAVVVESDSRGALDVRLELGGAATCGVDYRFSGADPCPTVVHFPAPVETACGSVCAARAHPPMVSARRSRS
ncbi:MAG TPA: fibronectin type III domain-containing protein, partial [Candidatus Thermoplasmatota archaeon]|nr:fibronectin type III domain-containing protein [Candidatus Thermoplasmatota archaeon]